MGWKQFLKICLRKFNNHNINQCQADQKATTEQANMKFEHNNEQTLP